MATPDAPSQPVCSLGISDRTLSALRDAALSRAKATRLAAHVETCPACRERLDAFDTLAGALRSERPPEPDAARLWQSIITAAGSTARVRRFSGFAPQRVSWRRLGAIAAVILLCISFVALFNLHRSTGVAPGTPTATSITPPLATPTALPTATATPSLLPARPLTWQTVGMPAQGLPSVFANDGETAYICDVEATLRIWHTSDRGAHWIPARVVPNDSSMNECELVVDASDPSVAALAWSPRGGGAGDPFTGLMTTVDGGATWQATPTTSFLRIDQLDSRGGVIYALRETADSSNSVEYHLWASSDRMQTWRQIDRNLPPEAFTGFWLQSDGQGIVVALSSGSDLHSPSELFLSNDDGASWRPLDVPGNVPPYWSARSWPFGSSTNGIAIRSIQGQFHICVLDMTAQSSQASVVNCSTDGGATWQSRAVFPAMPNTTTGSSGPQRALVDMTSDGTLLGIGSDASGSEILYRLVANSDHWQSLGPLPEPVVVYRPAPGSGMLWTTPYYLAPSLKMSYANYTP